MYVVRKGNEYLTTYETGGYYWTGEGLDGWRTWATRFELGLATELARINGGEVVKVHQ